MNASVTSDEMAEITYCLREALGVVNVKMHKHLNSYPEPLLSGLLDFCRTHDTKAITLIGQMIRYGHDDEFMETLITQHDFYVHDRYSTDLLIHLMLAYRKHDWFDDVVSGSDDARVAAMVKNTMSIIETALYNWELPEAIEHASMDHGNLKYVTRSFSGVVIFELTDPRLVGMVLDHPEHTERIESFLVERKTLDYDLLSSITQNNAPAMAEGTL